MKKGILKKCDKFKKEIRYIFCFAICFKDEYGEVIYTFKTKEKAEEFFKKVTS